MNFEIYTVMYYFILFAYIIVQFGWKARNVIDKGHLGFCLSSLSLLHVRLCESYWPPRTANLTTFLTDLFKHGIILDSLTMYLSYIQIHTYHIVNHIYIYMSIIVYIHVLFLLINPHEWSHHFWTSECEDGHSKAGEICYLAGAFPFSVCCWDHCVFIGLMNFNFHELQLLLGKTWNATTVVTNVKKSEIDGKQLVERPFQKSLVHICGVSDVSVFVFFSVMDR